MRRLLSRAAFVLALVSATAAQAQSVDEIVAKNLQAKGGAEKWKSVSSVKMTGRISMQGTELPLTVYAKRPNFTRQEVDIQDKKLVQAFDGTTGWLVNPLMGTEVPQEVPAPVAEMMKTSADFDGPLVDYKAKGNTIDLVGKEKLATREVYHLKVTTKAGQVQHYFLDAETGAEVKRAEDVDVGNTGQKQTLETEMSDFQTVDGVIVPRTIKQLMNGNPVVSMAIEKVEFNSIVDDAIFRMPKR